MAQDAIWSKIKAEYITDEKTSYKKLGIKYGVTINAIYKHSAAEKWPELRKKALENRVMKTADKIGDAEAENNACLQRVAGKMIQRIDDIISTLDSEIFMTSMKDISITIKNLRDVFDTPMSYRIKSAQLQQIEKQLDDNVQNVSEIIIKGADEDWTA